jgi:hypothetical protein
MIASILINIAEYENVRRGTKKDKLMTNDIKAYKTFNHNASAISDKLDFLQFL